MENVGLQDLTHDMYREVYYECVWSQEDGEMGLWRWQGGWRVWGEFLASFLLTGLRADDVFA